MADYKPPSPQSLDDPLNPPRTRTTVDASVGWWQANGQDVEAAASAIIDGRKGEVEQFVARQRQAVGLSDLNVHRRSASFDDLDLHYTSQFGHELLHYVVRPEAAAGGGIGANPTPEPIAVIFFDGVD